MFTETFTSTLKRRGWRLAPALWAAQGCKALTGVSPLPEPG
jgi:hypothetical protein